MVQLGLFFFFKSKSISWHSNGLAQCWNGVYLNQWTKQKWRWAWRKELIRRHKSGTTCQSSLLSPTDDKELWNWTSMLFCLLNLWYHNKKNTIPVYTIQTKSRLKMWTQSSRKTMQQKKGSRILKTGGGVGVVCYINQSEQTTHVLPLVSLGHAWQHTAWHGTARREPWGGNII